MEGLVCPFCKHNLELALVPTKGPHSGNQDSEGRAEETLEREQVFLFNGRSYLLGRQDIMEAAKSIEGPKGIVKYFVDIPDGSRARGWTKHMLPIKQLVREALRRKGFPHEDEPFLTSNRARDVLSKLGFSVETLQRVHVGVTNH